MDKIQQFFILKIQSKRLKELNFKIKNLTLEQARLNGEVISLSNSQVIRTIHKLTDKKFSQYALDKLLEKKKYLTRRKNKKENRGLLKELNKQIDDMLYIPQIISVSFDDKRHFYNILNKGGILVNGILYVPFMSSAGMIRRDTYLFIDSTLKDDITKIFNCGRNEEVEIVPSKFSAYYSLFSSSTIPVSFPRIAVVSDLLIKTVRKVDFSTYQGKDIDPKIEEIETEIECNAFDGEGLCSPALGKNWAKDLGITDYIPSTFGVRAPFLKGMVVVFDFHKFSEMVAKTNLFVDIYGNTIDINDVECIVSESMFKLWSSYENTPDYVEKCKENELDWGITKVSPKVEKNHGKTSYQFIQVLQLDDNQIEKLCEPTLSWLDFVSGGDIHASLLYLLGETNFSTGWFDRLDNPTQALILDNSLIHDSFFISFLDKSITKKKNDARIGRLIFNSNYQVMISDPYAYAAHVFGLGVLPLLQEGEHYSKYWNDRNKTRVTSIRSPIVHASEVNVLNLVDTDEVNFWFKHITSGIVFPANGVGMDASIEGGADFDLDLTCTLDNEEFIEGRTEGLPILYESVKPDKIKITSETEHVVVRSQVEQIKSNRIGFLTNVSSAFYSLLYEFDKESKEYRAISDRLKYGRVAQGLEIDRGKGLIIDPFPEHFVKWKKITEDMTDEEKEYWKFNNSIIANRRPYFMRWLYSHYNRRYLREIAVYDNISKTKWGISFDELKELEDKSDEQVSLLERFTRKSYFINNNSVMNRVAKHVDERLKQMKRIKSSSSREFDFFALLSNSFVKPEKRNLDKMQLLFKEYKSLKRSLREGYSEFNDNDFSTIEQIYAHINKKAYHTISSEARELGDIAVWLCYTVLGKNSKTFCWNIFGKEIVENIKNKKTENFVRVPMLNPFGSETYLWGKYGTYLLNIEE